MASKAAELLSKVESQVVKSDRPQFRVGDTVKVHNLIVEGQKERIQIFEGIVIKRSKGNSPTATFTVRKVSYHIGVERTFFVHSPRIEKIELVARGSVRRARLFYLRPLRGRAAAVAREEVVQPQQAKAKPAAPATETAAVAEGASA